MAVRVKPGVGEKAVEVSTVKKTECRKTSRRVSVVDANVTKIEMLRYLDRVYTGTVS